MKCTVLLNYTLWWDGPSRRLICQPHHLQKCFLITLKLVRREQHYFPVLPRSPKYKHIYILIRKR